MGILSWIFLGLVAGWLANIIAKRFLDRRAPGGFIATTALGVAGAFVGGLIGSWAFHVPMNKISLSTFGLAIVGSFLLILAYTWFTDRQKQRTDNSDHVSPLRK